MISYHSKNFFSNKIVYLSFWMSLSILFRHATNMDVYQLDNTSGAIYWIERTTREVTIRNLSAFFVLSGYLFFQNYSENKLLSKWKSRAFSIVLPYLFWSMVSYCFFQILYSIPALAAHINADAERFTLMSFVKCILSAEKNGPLWYLRYLMLYTLAFPLLYYLLKKRLRCVILLFLIYILSIFTDFGAYGIFRYAVFYGMGAFFGIHYKEVPKMKYSFRMIIGSLAVLVSSVVIGLVHGTLGCLDTAIKCLDCIAIWVLFDVVRCKAEPKWWMRLSFITYCMHIIILESIEKIILIIGDKTVTWAAIDFFVAPIITFPIVVLFSAVLKRIKPIWKIATGGRG